MHPLLGSHAIDWPRHEFSWAGLDCCLLRISTDQQLRDQPKPTWWNGYIRLPPSHAYYKAPASIIPLTFCEYRLDYNGEDWVGFATDRTGADLGEVSYRTKQFAMRLGELADSPLLSDEELLKILEGDDWNREEIVKWTLRRRLA